MRDFEMPKVDPDKEDEISRKECAGEMPIFIKYVGPPPEISIKVDGKNNMMSWEELEAAFNDQEYIKQARDFVDNKTSGKVCPVFDESKCSHSWKSYTGLSEQFVFCEKCDERK
jgi:hypothetical protein